MVVLGINTTHSNSSATIIIDGKIITSIEEERFVRIKNFNGFPVAAINFCLNYSNLTINDVDILSVNHCPYYNFLPKFIYLIKNFFNLSMKKLISNIRNKLSTRKLLYRYFGLTKKIPIIFVPHHKAHLYSSLLCSGVSKGIGVTIDGSGDFSTIEISNVKSENNIKLLYKENYPHSLGIFYQSISQYLGFKDYGDEYKVMGLSGYGKPKYKNLFKKIVNCQNGKIKLNMKYFQHNINIKEMEIGTTHYKSLYSSKLIKLLGKDRKVSEPILNRHRDIASTLQACFEEAILNLIKYYNNKIKAENIFLSGGCFFNSLLNMKIIESNQFKNISITPNSGDGGGSLGAALYASKISDKKFKNKKFTKVYLGYEDSDKKIKKNLDKFFLKNKKFIYKKFSSNNELYKKVSLLLKNNNIIGWHQGRAEYGPRSLGNRSILANSTNKKIKSIINKKIKIREPFRPFAPSVLSRYAGKYFHISKSFDYRYMTATCFVKKNMEKKIPAVLNIDNTARIQTVEKNDNAKFYNLLRNYYKLTKCPLLLNTSLNIQEPICNSVHDSSLALINSRLDALVVEKYLILRKK
jgi:carbamoyltransferase